MLILPVYSFNVSDNQTRFSVYAWVESSGGSVNLTVNVKSSNVSSGVKVEAENAVLTQNLTGKDLDLRLRVENGSAKIFQQVKNKSLDLGFNVKGMGEVKTNVDVENETIGFSGNMVGKGLLNTTIAGAEKYSLNMTVDDEAKNFEGLNFFQTILEFFRNLIFKGKIF